MPRNNFIILQFEQLVSRETKPLEKNPAMKRQSTLRSREQRLCRIHDNELNSHVSTIITLYTK